MRHPPLIPSTTALDYDIEARKRHPTDREQLLMVTIALSLLNASTSSSLA